MDNTAIESYLATHPLTRGLKTAWVQQVADSARDVRLRPGELILRQGDPARSFYIIRIGDVAIEAVAPDGRRVVVQHLVPGDPLGWSWLFPPRVWQFSARAATPVHIIEVDSTGISQLLEENPQLGFELMRRFSAVMLERLQAARRRLIDGVSPTTQSKTSD